MVIMSGTIIDACEKFETFLKEDSYSRTQMKPSREPRAELSEQGLVHIAWPSHVCLPLKAESAAAGQ